MFFFRMPMRINRSAHPINNPEVVGSNTAAVFGTLSLVIFQEYFSSNLFPFSNFDKSFIIFVILFPPDWWYLASWWSKQNCFGCQQKEIERESERGKKSIKQIGWSRWNLLPEENPEKRVGCCQAPLALHDDFFRVLVLFDFTFCCCLILFVFFFFANWVLLLFFFAFYSLSECVGVSNFF